jgi:uncharacterized protein
VAQCQTVWDVSTGRPLKAGILDYDLACFDPSDLSWAAGDAVVKRGDEVFAGLPAPVQIRNEADACTPCGLSELLGLIVRPGPGLAPRQVCEAEVARWTRQWPELSALPWPGRPAAS